MNFDSVAVLENNSLEPIGHQHELKKQVLGLTAKLVVLAGLVA